MARSKGYKHEYKTRIYNVDYKPGESDLQYYKRLAKAADQRLVRLEQLAGVYVSPKTGETAPGVPGYEAVTQYAYAKAMRDLELYGGGKRFNTKPPLNPDGTVDNRLLSEKLADMRAFLTSVTSTKEGINQVYQQRANTFNENFGTNYTWQQLADYYNSGDADKLAKDLSSATVQKAIGVVQHSLDKAKAEIEANTKVTFKDKAVADAALMILKRTDLSITAGIDKKILKRAEEIIKEEKKKKQKG